MNQIFKRTGISIIIVCLSIILWDLWPTLLIEATQFQRVLNEQLSDLLYDISQEYEGALLTFTSISFLYGLLHSLGAGHGKILVSSYLITNQGTISKALFITVTTSFLQAIVAITIVEVMISIYSSSMREVHDVVFKAIKFSYLCVIILGGVIVLKACNAIYVNRRTDECKANMKRGGRGIIFAVGLRPCSGAVMIMLFSNIVGLRSVGIYSALLMALGTCITTGSVACMVVMGKNGIVNTIAKNKKNTVNIVQIFGGCIVTLFGGILFITSSYSVGLVF